jgi:hypothetical protein
MPQRPPRQRLSSNGPALTDQSLERSRRIGIYRGSRDDSFGLVQSSVVQHWQCGCRLVSKRAARLAQRRPQGALLMNTTCAPQSKRHKPHSQGRNAARFFD